MLRCNQPHEASLICVSVIADANPSARVGENCLGIGLGFGLIAGVQSHLPHQPACRSPPPQNDVIPPSPTPPCYSWLAQLTCFGQCRRLVQASQASTQSTAEDITGQAEEFLKFHQLRECSGLHSKHGNLFHSSRLQ